MDIIRELQSELVETKAFPSFKSGDTITVSYKIKEGNKERIQQFQGVVIGLSVPIFAGSSIARAKSAKTNIEREQKNADYINQQFKSHLEQQSEQLATYASLIDYYKNTAVPNANLIIKNATKAYQNGDISYVEYVQSLETASQIQLNYSEAIYNYNQTIITIQYSINQ